MINWTSSSFPLVRASIAVSNTIGSSSVGDDGATVSLCASFKTASWRERILLCLCSDLNVILV